MVSIVSNLEERLNEMQKWKLIFDVTWEEGLPPKRQIFEAREELQFVLQLAQTLDACSTVKLIKLERED